MRNLAKPLPTDRWIEIDLYWFDPQEPETSAKAFWNRYYPLYRNVTGWKGVIICIGWLGDFIFEWKGNLDEVLALPAEMKTYPWYSEPGRLTGSTLDKLALWKERFEKASSPSVVNYESWTYRQVAQLAKALRQTAVEDFGIAEFKVGTFLTGWPTIYKGKETRLFHRQPQMYRGRQLNLPGRLQAEDCAYAAFPQGLPEGLPFTEYFGKQWGSLSREIGVDALVFRDSCLGVGIYSKTGPYGVKGPADPHQLQEWNDATADWIRQTKLHNPKALIIGYSNGASGVADWRVNCFDLESIAKEGHLDAWIDQTWAGAWNEVGNRPGAFWARQHGGWTYQLCYLLARAAVLAETPVRHYFLTETFDAWEAWDTLNGSRERLQWSIWAFSHAAVKCPDGLKMPAGTYISWGNKGKALLSESDVAFLSSTLNEAVSDASRTVTVHGPTMVYNRFAMAWANSTQPDRFFKEWIDEQVGTLIKWSVPCLSITRVEYLGQVDSDMFLLQTPTELPEKICKQVLTLLNSGQPVAVFGDPDTGIDKEITDICGITGKPQTSTSNLRYIGSTNFRTGGIFQDIPNTFPLYQQHAQSVAHEDVETLYSVDFSPCLTLRKVNGGKIIFWDPPEFAANHPFNENSFEHRHRSLDEIIGSPMPYVLLARLLNELARECGLSHASGLEIYRPVHLAFWTTDSGQTRLLAGQLEEGLNHQQDQSAQVTFHFSSLHPNRNLDVQEIWSNNRFTCIDVLPILLAAGEAKLFSFHPLPLS